MALFSTYRFLSDLLDSLAADGFDMGTGKHLQVQELLSKLPEDLPLASYKTLLAPLFATNRQDQERFYELFENAMRREELFVMPLPIPGPIPVEVKQVYLWRNVVLVLLAALAGVAGLVFDSDIWSTWLLALGVAVFAGYFAMVSLSIWDRRILYWSLLLLAGVVGFFSKERAIVPIPPKTVTQPFQVTPGEVHHIPLTFRKDSVIAVTFADTTTRDTNEVLGILQLDAPDSTCCFTFIARDSFPGNLNERITILTIYPKVTDTTYFLAQYQKPVEAVVVPEIDVLDTLPIPYPRNISDLYVDAKLEERAAFYKQWAWLIKLALSLLFGGILWAIVQWRERKRRRLVAELDRKDQPPYVWSLKLEHPEDIAFGEAIPILLNQLRRRRFSEAFRLDVPRTVTATVRSAGRVAFQFKQMTSPPDYLLLIDRHNYSDHRAALFNRLYELFRANEVNIERFYYQGDPRLCFNEAYPNGISLQELQHRFGEARLLLIGNGYDTLSPMTGKPIKWVNIFANWRERALFTPQPLGTWGRKEAALGDLFYLMPASIESFTVTLEEFGSTDPRQPGELIAKLEDVPWRPIEMDGSLLDTLHHHYPEKVVQWIAACAVFPTLNWDLTLHLGRELSTEAEPLLTLDNLFALTRLPWFVEGRIPDAAREDLIAYLQQAGLENTVRESLHHLFAQTPHPAADSVAYEDYRVSALTNELLFTTSRSKRRKLRKELNRYLAAGAEPDVVNFKYLQERQRSAVDFVVPEKWKERIAKAGDTFWGGKDWVWALPLWVVVVAGVWIYQPNFHECEGAQMEYKEQVVCLESGKDYLILQEVQYRDTIAQQKSLPDIFPGTLVGGLEIKSTLIPDADPIDSLQSKHNIAIYFYNAGAKLHNEWRHLQDSLQTMDEQEATTPQQQSNSISNNNLSPAYSQLQYLTDSLAAQSCENFTRGYALYQQLPDTTRDRTRTVGLIFELAIQGVCVDTTTIELPQETAQTVVRTEDNKPSRVEPDKPNPVILEPFEWNIMVTDAQTGRALNSAAVRALSGNIVGKPTRATGRFQLELPGELKNSLLEVDATADGYQKRTQSLLVSEDQATIALEPVPTVPDLPTKDPTDQTTQQTTPPKAIEPEMIKVTGGTFIMGCKDGRDTDCYDWEKPAHSVTLKEFYIGKYEITQAQWRAVMGNDPPELGFKGCDQCPVESVSWNDIQEFLKKLNAKTGRNYRLPTEAEWEYAARGGANSKSYQYAGSNTLSEVAWYDDNSGGKTHAVGQKNANELGIHDMSGNVWEWCNDWYDEYPTVTKGVLDNPKGATTGSNRVFRGGSWNTTPQFCRAANRNRYTPTFRLYYIGFRLAL